jgi:SAM-dependent methyltransferase
LTNILQFGFTKDLAVIDSYLKEGIDNCIEVTSRSISARYFGFAFLIPFYSGCTTTISFNLTIQNSQYFRIEIDGFTSRMQKAYVEFDSTGQIKVIGEEISSCLVEPVEGGNLKITFVFVPYRTRLAHFYIYSKNHLDAIDSSNIGFICSPISYKCEILPENNQEDISRRTTDLGTLISVNGLFQFRNYLQIDFEIYRPNLGLSGLKLIDASLYETIQWWTNINLKPLINNHELEHNYLTPRASHVPLPSPSLMSFLGSNFTFCGHRINALSLEIQDQTSSRNLDSDQIVRNLKLEALFEDGSIEIISLIPPELENSEQFAPEFKFIDSYAKKIDNGRPLFLEVGARGPRSEGIRRRVESQFRYIGLDASSGVNVDLVGDAHHLSKLLDSETVDIVYSDDVIEHLIDPFAFIAQAHKALKMNGLFIAKVPTTWPLHAEPCDFWRISSHAWKGLLNSHTGYEILASREIGTSAVVPSILSAYISANTQYAPAPLFTLVVAKKISRSEGSEFGSTQDLGKYDHWSLQSKPDQ